METNTKQIGTIVYYNKQSKHGELQIQGKIHSFSLGNLVYPKEHESLLIKGSEVSVTFEENTIRVISLVDKSKLKNRTVYAMLALLLGMLGIHDFYIGKTTEGLIKLLLNIFLCWTIIVPVIIFFITIIEAFIIDKDKQGYPLYW